MKKQYTTPARRAVLSLFQSYPHRHFTAEQVCTLVCQTNEQGTALMGKSTVYRQLAQLCESGLLRRFEQTDGAGGAVHTYQYVAPEQDCEAHFHLKCSVCGRVSHLECELTETVAQHLREHHGFVVHCGDSILHGVCLDCQNKRKEKSGHGVF